ncbi:LacI family DNA-binding transcriptional regulator [Paenibacillus roseipurpureus]|uniref:LacI family DNA-binding transcriptional regulator n=1 Tax=Paenibacillus roseopurpureus TaxID=2918901 RepID=A0AA96RLJ0_9BACL|nr:LacI family DNA-binding transcriptional regulator [Paenibacillus sp. MBLB1832]WNR45469.1 LacI family DNA-binding transcriptional regulator [Paenibacillus sp. MBLB1832]
MPTRKTVTLKTIAHELGLTVQTVNKALKGKQGMSEATRQLIVQTAEKLGYYTMDQIRSLRLEHIAPYPNERLRFLLVQTADSVSFNQLLLQGLQNRFFSFGHRIELLRLPLRMKPETMAAWLEEHGVTYADGIFIAPSILPLAWETALFNLPIPRILLNFPPSGVKIDSVIWDVYEATCQSVAYLRSLGHANIMYVGDPYLQRGYILRWQAFNFAMQASGLTVTPSEHGIGKHDATDQWRDEIMHLIQQHQPSAILCGIDREVAIVHDVCTELGLRIPADISLIGLLNDQPDTLPLFTRPVLSIAQTGYRAADRMLWRIANPTLPYEHIRIQGEFYVGHTTVALNGG